MKRVRTSISFPVSNEDFTLVYNTENKFPVSRAKLGLYSQYFRKLPFLFKLESFEITDSAPVDTFKEFLAAIQGKEFHLSENSFFDFLRLSSNYEAENAVKICTNYFHRNPQIQNILKETQKIENENNISNNQKNLCDLIASHLDDCIKDPEFSKLQFQTVDKILSSKEKVMNDRKLLHNYLINLIPSLDTAAYDLFSYIELQDLDDPEIKQIFTNIQLMKYFSSKKKVSPSSGDITCDFEELHYYSRHIEKRIRRLEKMRFQDQFEGISDQFCDIEDRIEAEAKRRQQEARKDFNQDTKVEKKLKQMADRFAATTLDVLQRIKKQDTSQNTRLKELDVRTQSLRSQFEPIRAEMREMQRMLRVANVRQISITERINEHAKQREQELAEKPEQQAAAPEEAHSEEEEETVDLTYTPPATNQ